MILVLVLIIFSPITKTFYQQDEWQGYGLYLAGGQKYIFQNVGSVAGMLLGEGRILSNYIYYLFFKHLPLNVLPFAIFSIFFHFVNSVLVFSLINKFLKNLLFAIFGAFFFVLNSVSQNAITWPAASPGILPATTLIILSIFTFLNYVEKGGKKWLFATFVLLYVSLLFKEMGIYLFLFFPLASLLFAKVNVKRFLLDYWPFLTFFLINTFFRVSQFRAVGSEQALFLTGATNAYWQTLLARAFSYPLTSFSLVFVPPEPFLWFARSLTNIYYPFVTPQLFILIAQTVVLDLLAVSLTFILFFVVSLLVRVVSKNERKYIGFAVGFILFSFLPYIIIGKSYAYLESRYYYLASVCAAVIFAWLVKTIFEKTRVPTFKILVLLFAFYFLGEHLKYLRTNVSNEVLIGQERKLFLTQLLGQLPALANDKNVILIKSDRDFYVEGNKIPFQQGTGHMLMSVYYPSGEIPSELLKESYLFEIGSQGYREVVEGGFGFFTDQEKLSEIVKLHRLPADSVVSFYYHSSERRLERIK
jgi:hypothetical protein